MVVTESATWSEARAKATRIAQAEARLPLNEQLKIKTGAAWALSSLLFFCGGHCHRKKRQGVEGHKLRQSMSSKPLNQNGSGIGAVVLAHDGHSHCKRLQSDNK